MQKCSEPPVNKCAGEESVPSKCSHLGTLASRSNTSDAREMGQEHFPSLCMHSVSDRHSRAWNWPWFRSLCSHDKLSPFLWSPSAEHFAFYQVLEIFQQLLFYWIKFWTRLASYHGKCLRTWLNWGKVQRTIVIFLVGMLLTGSRLPW